MRRKPFSEISVGTARRHKAVGVEGEINIIFEYSHSQMAYRVVWLRELVARSHLDAKS